MSEKAINNEIKKVYVVFKTHLDIGFTDLACNVVDKYMNSYIPSAIKLGYELKDNKDINFKWTTGSWLIYNYLKTKSGDELKTIEKAIEDGIINWHGLPCTTHTELMDRDLFEFGLSLSQKLDKRFHKKTVAAKMTDVPGHTKAIIPMLAKAGIKFLHLGVNPASAVPKVPEFFTWVGEDGSEIIVCYSSNYGQDCIMPLMREVLYFAHTGDNLGPQTKENVIDQYVYLKKRYPNAQIAAATLDDFAGELYKYKDMLPKVYEEIGDSWIHGTASDPYKVARFRELLRLRKKWLSENKFAGCEKELEDFSLNLLLVPEHTWGMDTKTHLGDFKNYKKEDFNRARKVDIVDDSAQLGLNWGAKNRSYSKYESSWKEQRGYIDKALGSLPDELKSEAAKAFENMSPLILKDFNGKKLSLNKRYRFADFDVEFDKCGAINYLASDEHGIIFDDNNRCGLFIYEEIGKESYDFCFKNYIRDFKSNDWAYADFGKPFFESAGTVTKEYEAFFDSGFYKDDADRVTAVINISSDEYAVKELGCPKDIQIVYTFYKDKINLDLVWNNKDASRLPESIWLSINPKVDNENMWYMDKMGCLISPLKVVRNGGKNLHAVSKVEYLGADKKIKIISLDAPLAAMGGRKILRYDNKTDLSQAVSFNLYNNIWGTNFRMWYEDDTKYRFIMEFSK